MYWNLPVCAPVLSARGKGFLTVPKRAVNLANRTTTTARPAMITRCHSASGMRYAAPALPGKSSTQCALRRSLVMALDDGAERSSPCGCARSVVDLEQVEHEEDPMLAIKNEAGGAAGKDTRGNDPRRIKG